MITLINCMIATVLKIKGVFSSFRYLNCLISHYNSREKKTSDVREDTPLKK